MDSHAVKPSISGLTMERSSTETNPFFAEKARVDGMRPGENRIEENPSEKGKKFDPKLVDIFIEHIEEIKEIYANKEYQ